ncbi:MAG: aspartate carbamoyltransferase [Cellvibrionales bacterium]|nr:MAG: aspartate carbamoyltransferase [Cellvibrionales bacterium]
MNKHKIVKFLWVVLFAGVVGTSDAQAAASEERLDEVARKGSHVMPFDLEATTHVFSRTTSGGVQKIVVKKKTDVEQLLLIREHLLQISTAFDERDFSSPAEIHGDVMPGLAELRVAQTGDLSITYKELPDGASLTYSTEKPYLVNALHRWFDAQLRDHSRHAIEGYEHHSMQGASSH